MPTEEVSTTPDCRRAEGTVRASCLLVLDGDIIERLQPTVKDGNIVDVQADEGEGIVRGQLEIDDCAGYSGEPALVDGTSRVGQMHRRSSTRSTTTPRRSTSPTASAFPEVSTASREGMNISGVDTDFMVGGPEPPSTGRRTTARAIRSCARTLAAGLSRPDRIDRYAEPTVQVGANVEPGQLVEVIVRIEHAHARARSYAPPTRRRRVRRRRLFVPVRPAGA